MRADVKEVFDLFDFWDGRDGLVDGAKIGDVMRCIGLNPTNKQILENGGTKKFGQFPVMESSRTCPWPRGSSRTISIVLGLGLVGYVLGLGIGLVDKVLEFTHWRKSLVIQPHQHQWKVFLVTVV